MTSDATPQMAVPKLPDTVPAPPVFGQPQGAKPKQKSQQAVYLGPNASPSISNAGYKTLVGT